MKPRVMKITLCRYLEIKRTSITRLKLGLAELAVDGYRLEIKRTSITRLKLSVHLPVSKSFLPP